MRKGKSYFRRWEPEKVVDEKLQRLSRAFGRFGLQVEADSKRELRKGHGVLTGTLRRSIHTAEPGYDFGKDDVEPSASTPERGGRQVNAAVAKRQLSLLVGSGLVYALVIHRMYKYLTLGLKRARPTLPKFINAEFKK
jgi:hypothetical protein